MLLPESREAFICFRARRISSRLRFISSLIICWVFCCCFCALGACFCTASFLSFLALSKNDKTLSIELRKPIITTLTFFPTLYQINSEPLIFKLLSSHLLLPLSLPLSLERDLLILVRILLIASRLFCVTLLESSRALFGGSFSFAF